GPGCVVHRHLPDPGQLAGQFRPGRHLSARRSGVIAGLEEPARFLPAGKRLIAAEVLDLTEERLRLVHLSNIRSRTLKVNNRSGFRPNLWIPAVRRRTEPG